MKKTLLILCIIFLFFSCGTGEDPQNEEQEVTSFYALQVGNSWVYKSLKYNISEEVYNDTEIIDSVSIVGTEDILGITYFKFKTKTTGSTDSGTPYSNPNGIKFDYFREVNGNLVNENNEIIFTTTDYTEHPFVEGNWGIIYQKLAEDLSTIEVPSGTFLCYNKKQYARSPDGDLFPSMDNYYYAEGVGLIQDSVSLIFLGTPIMIRQLYSYNIN